MSAQLSVIVLTLVLLLLEIIKGRHRHVYRREDLIITGGSFLFGRTLVAPLLAAAMGMGKAHAQSTGQPQRDPGLGWCAGTAADWRISVLLDTQGGPQPGQTSPFV
ncbi:hypothetical protein I6N98_13330 [Spongiibacter nanhainus]|uniref:Uncharacterized protein n=1 Tax=Spongiibacter nanhainus TaxID=2794344 RepID=A0A7T4QZ25_9GAMM|nr:hypothetical protein [Spongiibacter nanhainus]QQD17341.1 hypothetical protein I6N98_13330 [Spongiibacter nanhainus]